MNIGERLYILTWQMLEQMNISEQKYSLTNRKPGRRYTTVQKDILTNKKFYFILDIVDIRTGLTKRHRQG